MAIDVSASIQIRREPAVVAAYMFDPANDKSWIAAAEDARLKTPGPLGVGAQIWSRVKFLGKTFELELAVKEFLQNRKMVLEAIKGPFPLIVTYQVYDVGDHLTAASMQVEGTGASFFGIVDLLISPIVRSSLVADLQSLKGMLEAQPALGDSE